MTYQLPEPYHFGLTPQHTWLSITPDQYEKLKAIYRMSSHSHETLIKEVAKAELRGRESMREECLQECSAEATDNGTAQRIEEAIRNLK